MAAVHDAQGLPLTRFQVLGPLWKVGLDPNEPEPEPEQEPDEPSFAVDYRSTREERDLKNFAKVALAGGVTSDCLWSEHFMLSLGGRCKSFAKLVRGLTDMQREVMLAIAPSFAFLLVKRRDRKTLEPLLQMPSIGLHWHSPAWLDQLG